MGNRSSVTPVVPFPQSNQSRSSEQRFDNSQQLEQSPAITTTEQPKNNRSSKNPLNDDDKYADRERSTTEKLYDYLQEIACRWTDNDAEAKWNEVEKQIEHILKQDLSCHFPCHRRKTMEKLIVKLNEELYSPLHNYLNVRGNNGETVLHMVARAKQESQEQRMIEPLLKGANIEAYDDEHRTPVCENT
ncbi:unnamed protein product [Didymodactylos carnosus]|uniref:Uncharacterized protein n=1 Tax=Didymodactylos carnosus TaxID=1234261 RepID=A0A815FU84_9BILA|nr:unnamed protein product [Didymodactylos carnosus]CAF4174411.1 unnamed protein product [Didymodactylos carnosus]